MQYVLDGVILLIPIVCIILGYRRGFVRSVIQLVGAVAAFVIAMTVGSTLATMTFDGVISEPLQETMVKVLQESDTATVEEQIDAALAQLPKAVTDMLHADEAAKQALNQLKQQVDESAPAVAETLVTTVIRPLAVSLIHFLLFILLFILLTIVVKFIVAAVKPVTKLPLIHQVDGLLGAGVGLLKGAVFALVAVTVMQLFMQEWLSQTAIASWLAENNPVKGILSL